ncbi:glycosyltransferase family 8 protein [Clostridium perfringens]|uniref:glycosyltransferase family 8 protein n=1 Tax=Clostridium perfringens TaxID=1502 RepID=UPI000D7174BB|nr:glycosyltransferase family 8 protein [Clostridium perfringens]PWW98581.1 glycosyltransferase family 8 protein [Clostridium perfringens]
MKLNVAYSTDENYAKHAWISICSLLENNKKFDEINIYIIDNNITEKTKRNFFDLINGYGRNLIFLKFNDIVKGIDNACPWQNSLSAYGRLFLGNIKNIDKILYLDCDTVINGSLEELWSINIEKYYLAGVQDTAGPRLRLVVGLKYNDRYINSGVVLINLKKWREDNLEKNFIDFINKYNGDVPCADQGTINGVCKNKILIIHPKYNTMTPMFSFSAKKSERFFEIGNYYNDENIKEAVKNPIIIHYVGGFFIRPWFKNSDHPKKDIYVNYLSLSPWKNLVMDNGNLGLRTDIMKILYKTVPFSLFIGTHRVTRYFKNIFNKGAI